MEIQVSLSGYRHGKAEFNYHKNANYRKLAISENLITTPEHSM
jgi:hypothetical protein